MTSTSVPARLAARRRPGRLAGWQAWRGLMAVAVGCSLAVMAALAAPAQAGSTSLTSLTPAPDWTVTLTASATWLLPTQYSALTATASMDVGPTPYYTRIYDLTAGAYVATCGSGTTCSAPVTQPAPGYHCYVAVVSFASAGYPPSGEQAVSAGLCVTWHATSAGPRAALSIDPASPALTVEFVAQAQAFPEPVMSYSWAFGDGRSATTTTATVTHAYASASVFTPSVTVTDIAGETATATAMLSLNECPAGVTQCTESLRNAGAIGLLQVTGPVSPANPAEADLLAGTFSFPGCDPVIDRAVAVADSGFTGNLALTLSYTTSNPRSAQITCFSSTVAFVDAAGALVNSGPLPACSPLAPTAPCVESITISGQTVSKQLLIPPGDPTVGAPETE